MTNFYTNPQVPEGINVSDKHPLRSFLFYTGITVGILVALIFAIGVAAGLAAPYIPFEWEASLLPKSAFTRDKEAGPADRAIETELQRLADKIVAVMDIPKGISIRVHYNDDKNVVNAFATLGGHIVVYRGILDRIEHEDALAALLAHEIAHVAHRDVIRRSIRGIGVLLLMAGVEPGGQLLKGVSTMSGLSYSRSQESAADQAALDALGRLYGHTGGAVELFEVLARVSASMPLAEYRPPEIFSSHPDIAKRIERSQSGNQSAEKPLTPLSPALVGALGKPS